MNVNIGSDVARDDLAVLIVLATGSDVGRICFTYGVVEAVRRDLARPILESV